MICCNTTCYQGGSPDTALSYSTLHTPHSTLTLTLNTLINFGPHSFFLGHICLFPSTLSASFSSRLTNKNQVN